MASLRPVRIYFPRFTLLPRLERAANLAPCSSCYRSTVLPSHCRRYLCFYPAPLLSPDDH
jgi:hypothetical protein